MENKKGNATISMDVFEHNGQKLSYLALGDDGAARVFIWAHGWGHSHANLLPMAESLMPLGRHYVLDFPGFGASPLPTTPWTLTDYADLSHAFIQSLGRPVIWIGHSFGCRVALRLAALHPGDIEQAFLLSAPGLKMPRPWYKDIGVQFRIRLFKFLKRFTRTEAQRDALRARFGSADYRNAGPLRPTFLNVIADILDNDAKAVKAPVTLIYGEEDQDTPPLLGPRFKALMPQAELHILPRFDHYTILGPGRHMASQIIKDALTGA